MWSLDDVRRWLTSLESGYRILLARGGQPIGKGFVLPIEFLDEALAQISIVRRAIENEDFRRAVVEQHVLSVMESRIDDWRRWDPTLDRSPARGPSRLAIERATKERKIRADFRRLSILRVASELEPKWQRQSLHRKAEEVRNRLKRAAEGMQPAPHVPSVRTIERVLQHDKFATAPLVVSHDPRPRA